MLNLLSRLLLISWELPLYSLFSCTQINKASTILSIKEKIFEHFILIKIENFDWIDVWTKHIIINWERNINGSIENGGHLLLWIMWSGYYFDKAANASNAGSNDLKAPAWKTENLRNSKQKYRRRKCKKKWEMQATLLNATDGISV